MLSRYLLASTILMTACATAAPQEEEVAGAESPLSPLPLLPIELEKELVITNPLVVRGPDANPGGAYHIATLFREMLPETATNREVSDLIFNWAASWRTAQAVNRDVSAPRPGVSNAILCGWINASGGVDCQMPADGLNLNLAPFRLLAIVNRVDLMNPRSCVTEPGEARLVFALLNKPTALPQTDPSAFPMPATFIFEYKLPTSAPSTNTVTWANRWHALGSLSCDSTDCTPYRTGLRQLVRSITSRNVASQTPNGNSLSQLRTNELLPGSPFWQMKEFNLVAEGTSVNVRQATVKQNPREPLVNDPVLVDVLKNNADAIMDGSFNWAKSQPKLLGSKSNSSGAKWLSAVDDASLSDIPGRGQMIRKAFINNTCDGCHENQTGDRPNVEGFYHISPSGRVSDFVIDDAQTTRTRVLSDLVSTSSCTMGFNGFALASLRSSPH